MESQPDKPGAHVPAKKRRGSVMRATRTPYTGDQHARRQRFERLQSLIKPNTKEQPS